MIKMRKTLLQILVGAALLALPVLFTRAETAKFRYLTSVYFDDKGIGLKQPEGVACNDQGVFVVGDTGNDRLLQFTFAEKTVKGGREIKINQLAAPMKVQLNSKGEIYALDGKERRIVHLSPGGEFIGFVAPQGAPPPSTLMIRSFKIDSADNVYILDVFSARILVLNAEGKFQKSIPLPADIGAVPDLAIDFAGNVLVVDSIGRKLYSAGKEAAGFSQLGQSLRDSLTTLPSSITAIRGAVFVAEGRGSSIVTLGQDGSFLARQLTMGWNEGTLNYPCQICINEKDEAFIADRDNSRVQVFSLIR